MNMKDSMRSGGVLKKKSSSGCLIIKKKVENGSSGGGWEGLSGNSSERKRPRLVAGGFGASDEDESLEFMRGKVNDKRSHGGSIGCRRNEFENRQCDRNNVRIDLDGEQRRRSRLGSFEFDDEYGEFDESRMREDYYLEDRLKMVGFRGDENHKDFVVRRHFDGSGSKSSKGGRNRGFELEEDEAEMPTSLLRLKYPEVGDQPIRLQGKNGVLKLMVNKKKKKMDLHSHNNYDPREVEARVRSRSEDLPKKGLLSRIPIYPASKPTGNRGLLMEKERTVEKEQVEVKLEKVKPKLSKGIKATESETSGMSKGIKVIEKETVVTDTALKLAPPGLLASSSKKVVKKEEERVPHESVTPVKGKEGKVKRGGGCTEKQMLREKIREMLIDSGWTIDYRPRRNRDYLDAVYINPSGTAYWSIIKAYEALKKQLDEDNSKTKLVIDSPSFAPLSEDLINKLTRQTKKKIEQEMKRKRKEDGLAKSAKESSVREDARESSDSDHNEERLSSCKKQYKYQGGKYPDVDQGSDSDLRDDWPKRKSRKIKVEKDTTSNLNVLQGRTSKVIGRCTLRVRSSDKEESSLSDGYIPYSGKRTLLAWLIDSGTAQLSEKVQYMNRRRNRVMLEGWITRDGIHCGCCSKILTVSKFELHAGSKLRQPFQHIFLESGHSLLQCQIDAWNRQGESVCRDFHTVGVDGDGDDPDDDTCGICGDGGALICCDSCPSTFHQICLEIKVLPSGDWHCPNCICKFCGDANGNAAEENNGNADELARCSFCVEKYHKSCSEGMPMSSIGPSFCGLKCQELYDHLQKILGVKLEMEGGFSWSLIQRTDVSDTLHRGFPQRVESNSKLAVALSIMDECFLRINDRRSGINMINNVVYNIGSNFNRLNYCGFYTGILERGDEIISAASIRIHGTRLAEMPFIGTRQIYRRQGMCKRLLSAIETELQSLEVKHLIIPAIPEHMTTWTAGFGFHQLDDVLRKEIKSMNMLVFPGTDMLEKTLVKNSDGMKISVSIKKQPQLPVKVEKSDIYASMDYEKQMSIDSAMGHDTKMNDKVSDPDTDSPGPAPSYNAAASTPDSVLVSNGGTMIKSEVENNRKESSASSSGPLNASKYKNINVHGGNSHMEAVVGNTCTIEAPCVKNINDSSVETIVVAGLNGKEDDFAFDDEESTHLIGNIGSSVKVCEDAGPQATVDNGFVLEASSLSATNGEDVRIEDQPTARATEGNLHSSMDALANSAAIYGATTATRNAEIECKDNIHGQNSLMVNGAGPDEAADPVRADKPVVEAETARFVSGEVAFISSESLAQTRESITEYSVADGEINR